MLKPALLTALLLTISNAFMTIAWYWHLKDDKTAMWKVVLISWGIAGVEYCFAMPANRLGTEGGLSGAQLKIMQEVITLTVFAVFSVTYLGEPLKWNYLLGFVLVLAAVAVVFCF